ncbi:AAA family ATPase [Caulobacter radicis]|uniref:ATPase n=1 Tax=Caulobacter radicis TaxID=2172650 RepID=A0A2T9JTA8_9CAUL|nr:AAA family ATPase [Caulobacter radicis]PVM86952.1 ATPase [Caulobacter radicis]
MADNFVLITGCSGGGKSSLLAQLAARGYAVVEEPGRRIVRQAQGPDDHVLPWIDPSAFARRAIELALADREAARGLHGWVFFDRGLVDAASALEAATGEPSLRALDRAHRYHRRVFLAPPWPEIHVADAERRHGFDAALDEYGRLEAALPALDYEVVVLPRTSVAARADFVLATLEA